MLDNFCKYYKHNRFFALIICKCTCINNYVLFCKQLVTKKNDLPQLPWLTI